ncbi:MAG: ABC transporter permease [Planctomycetales bacterium]|nr:ABC transporter permease [Planctomycetales bacterium]
MHFSGHDELERYAHVLDEAQAIKGVSLGKDAWRRLRKNYAAMASLVFLIVLFVLAMFVPFLPLQSPIRQDLSQRKFQPPSRVAPGLGVADLAEDEYRLAVDALFGERNAVDRALIDSRVALFGDRTIPSYFGTDELGRDLLARTMWGARVSLMVGIVATLVSLVIGVTYGAFAGYVGGAVDNLMMRFVDVLYSIPFIFVVIFLLTILSEDTIKQALGAWGINKIVIFYFVIGAIYWLTMARVVRGQVISLKEEQFIEAARTIGATRTAIVFRHLIPNLLSIAIVYLTLTIPAVMLFEAFLSFLGLGVDPPDVSWGILANDGIKVITPVRIYWWLVVFPGLALAMTLFALNFLGDGLRDALDPRMKNR